MSNKWIHVVAALIVKNNNQYLIAKRPADKHQGNLWEFPGGKVDLGEDAFTALKRELREELDIDIFSAQEFLKIKHMYADKNIFLDIYKVYDYSGEEKPKASQEIRWVTASDIGKYSFPKANQLIVDALGLPELIAITPAEISEPFITKNMAHLKKHNIGAVLYRDYVSSDEQYLHNARILNNQIKNDLSRLHPSGNKVGVMIARPEVMNHYGNEFLGLHLNSQSLKKYQQRPVGEGKILSASCHNQQEIDLAEKLQCDFIYLAPILKTNTHPQSESLGWLLAERLVRKCRLPVILLGGLGLRDLSRAKRIGALGIAGISDFWV